jgi:1,4-dihydroxy-2-naphthoate octaprenyltransferase
VLIYRAMLVVAYVAVGVLMAFGVVPLECSLVFLSVAPAIRLWRDIGVNTTPERLDPVVKRTAGYHLLFGVLYTAGVLLAWLT